MKKLVAYGFALLALAGVFALYTNPRTMVLVSDFIWACFN